jgi:hypothetical protein
MGKTNSKNAMLEAIKSNDDNIIKQILSKNRSLANMPVNQKEDHPSLCMAAFYGNLNAAKALVEVILYIN